MDKGRFLIETHLRTGRSIGELAAAHGVHRCWLYKLLARYRQEGPPGSSLGRDDPSHSPTRLADRHEEAIVAVRKELTDTGFDAGAVTIHYHLPHSVRRRCRRSPRSGGSSKPAGSSPPSPTSAQELLHRFEADLPNECWQADVTHVLAADGTFFEVLNIIDDHSACASSPARSSPTRSPDVVRALHRAA